ncbi:MAG: 2-oxoacid:acceptor oxidoreductase family protein [Acholeplasma sp.]|nr:2-oxoacid:acceptor oxidoreductase family protein [Acholeplasma sp.]
MTKTIRIAGFGGQGVMLLGQVLAYSATLKGLNAIWVPTYGPETRGGTANCMVTISDEPIYSPVFQESDDLIVLNEPSYLKFKNTVKNNGYMLFNESLIKAVETDHYQSIGIKANDMASSLNEPKTINMVLLGRYLKDTNLFDKTIVLEALKYYFGSKKEHLIEVNSKAINLGFMS